jgi:hypothetical protein
MMNDENRQTDVDERTIERIERFVRSLEKQKGSVDFAV